MDSAPIEVLHYRLRGLHSSAQSYFLRHFCILIDQGVQHNKESKHAEGEKVSQLMCGSRDDELDHRWPAVEPRDHNKNNHLAQRSSSTEKVDNNSHKGNREKHRCRDRAHYREYGIEKEGGKGEGEGAGKDPES
ncbi:hypothetical protein DM860_005860 [Cuscuta australis]|uniref:Uncharacterized protein n=1 Tax=Cuscuta australis TaxID=267555 RepID=A0A328DSU7_9ASTE|nr:hypothetical protein DM860_005860 [Cuscuta australis]